METDIRKLALAHAKAAIDVLAEIMTNRDAPAAARISAAKSILDRGLGKVTTYKAEPESREERVVRIERVIVDPKVPDPETPIPDYPSEHRPYRHYGSPANDRFPREREFLAQQDQAQRAPPAIGDYSDYTMTGGDGWG